MISAIQGKPDHSRSDSLAESRVGTKVSLELAVSSLGTEATADEQAGKHKVSTEKVSFALDGQRHLRVEEKRAATEAVDDEERCNNTENLKNVDNDLSYQPVHTSAQRITTHGDDEWVVNAGGTEESGGVRENLDISMTSLAPLYSRIGHRRFVD